MRFTKTAAIALAAGIAATAGIAAAGTARAATPSCGHLCIDVFSADFTDGLTSHPQFVMDVYKREQAAGAPVILFRASNSDPAEDFVASEQGTVNDFYLAGLVSSAVELHYGCVVSLQRPSCTKGGVTFPDDEAYEAEYAPYGAESGLCAGLASTATANAKVTLQACGVSSKTVWIADTFDGSLFSRDIPLINGSDTNFSQPFVLTYPASSFPTDMPRPQMFVTNITGSASGVFPVEGTVDDNQLWSADFGALS